MARSIDFFFLFSYPSAGSIYKIQIIQDQDHPMYWCRVIFHSNITYFNHHIDQVTKMDKSN